MARNNPSIKIETAAKVLTYIIGFTGFLSVVKHISLLYSFAFFSLYLLSMYIEYKKKFILPRWFLNIMSLSLIAVIVLRLAADDFVLVIAEALLMLVAIKFLEEKQFRDHMQIYLLTIFLLAASALLSLDILFLVFLVSLAFLLSTALVLLTYYSQDNALEIKTGTLLRITFKSLPMPVLSIPVTILLFVILPRSDFALFSSLNRGASAKSGFTDTVTLGVVSNIQEDAAVALRAHMEKVDERLLYWRGIVLDHYDGKSWKSLHKEDGVGALNISLPAGKRVSQIIYLEPYDNRYLFALDKPAAISARNASIYNDLTYAVQDGITRRMRYEVISILSDVLPEKLTSKSGYLQLPEDKMQKIRALVTGLSYGKNKEAAVEAIFGFFKKGNYSYSLKNLPLSENPLEDFLFTYRYGNCEYFASTLAVMLRMAEIPSRIVGGYLGGYYNDAGRYYLVSQKNAHVWVEAYLDNRGWIRLDPTPAGIEAFTSPYRQGIAFRIRLFFDTLQYHWNALVINYDFERQRSLFQKLRSEIKRPTLTLSINKGKAIRYSAVLLIIILSGMTLYFFRLKRRSPEENILIPFLKKMERLGYKKSKTEGLEEFAAKIADARLRDRAFVFVREFEKSFYRDKKISKEDTKKLNKITSLLFHDKKLSL